MTSPTRLAALLLLALAAVYFYGMTRTGMLSADEPRYASIGRAMAQTGDWVTPKLLGKPWFEKPPALYWMTAAATRLGLGPDLAPRLPMALLGFGFVLFFYYLVRREFGPAEALCSAAILGTSAGWVAYSYVAVTDIPLAASFAAALLLTLEWVRGGEGSTARALAVGALLGVAVLAKGLVPLVLFAPVVWPMRRRFGRLLQIGLACLAIAGPWYGVCTFRNGTPFLHEFIWKHHFERFSSDSLQHVRPFWFYIPVLLGAVFPWTPLAVLIRPGLFRDARVRFVGVWLLYAMLFFSASKNKLPGYLIPLLPAASLLLGLSLSRASRTYLPLFLAVLLLAVTPFVAAILPGALEEGLSRTPWQGYDWRWGGLFLALAAAPLILGLKGRRLEALAAAGATTAMALIYLKFTALPVTDRVRPFYQAHQSSIASACLEGVDRDARYALEYYAEHEIPSCNAESPGPRIRQSGLQLLETHHENR
ncbi:MAG: glycosyltransferase family 39 protein [Acidobacteria bacterium]|nr:glycosyltransferase family 39 protein [Acidobacteriota bacterium]